MIKGFLMKEKDQNELKNPLLNDLNMFSNHVKILYESGKNVKEVRGGKLGNIIIISQFSSGNV